MNEGIQFVDVVEAGHAILDAIGNERTWSAVDHENDDFKRGAMWGMAWAMNHIYTYAPKYYAKEVEENVFLRD